MYVFRFRKDLINIDRSDYHFFLPPPSHLSLYVFVGPSLNTDEGKVHQNNLIISNPWTCCVARKEDRKGLQDHRKSGSITSDTKDKEVIHPSKQKEEVRGEHTCCKAP